MKRDFSFIKKADGFIVSKQVFLNIFFQKYSIFEKKYVCVEIFL